MATQEVVSKVTEKLKEAMAAPNCCTELKEVGQEWLDAVGTDRIDEASKKLIAELEEDVCDLEGTLQFFASPAAKEHFGEEQANALLKKTEEAKAAGVTYCICEACTAGGVILDMKDELLA